MKEAFFHEPVLVNEVIDFLNVKPGKNYLDATVGGGGHAAAIVACGGRVFGLDVDPEALQVASAKVGDKGTVRQGNFRKLRQLAREAGAGRFAGILFDLGASTHQLTSLKRGFSFRADSKLDMRMDPRLAVSAADLVNALGKKELITLFRTQSQEVLAGPIAQAIMLKRREKPFETTQELADLVAAVYARFGKHQAKLHPATKVFLALRMAVNEELSNLRDALPQAVELLETGGRLVVMSFHEGEDRVVKRFLKGRTDLTILTKKPVIASEREVEANPNSRSAKLRAAEKLETDNNDNNNNQNVPDNNHESDWLFGGHPRRRQRHRFQRHRHHR